MMGFDKPEHEASFRRTSDKPPITFPKTQVCPECKRSRSPRQFDEGFYTCKKCRGVK